MIEIHYPSVFVSALIVLVVAGVSWLVLYRKLRWFYGILFYSVFSKFFSVIYLSLVPTYMVENRLHSETDLAYLWYFWGFLLLLLGVKLGDFLATRVRVSVQPKVIRGESQILFLVSILILFIYLGNLILSGGGVLKEGVDRFNFWKSYSYIPEEFLIFGVLLVFVPVVFVIKYSTRSSIRPLIFLLLLYFFYLFMSGQKFHGFLVPFGLVIAVFLTSIKMELSKHGFIAILIFIVGVSVYAVIDIGNRGISDNFSSSIDTAIYRVVGMQGSAFKVFFQIWDGSGYVVTMPSFFSHSWEVRDFVLDEQLIKAYDGKGVNLSVGMFHLVLGFVPMNIVILILYGVFISVFFRYFSFVVRKHLFVECILLSYIYIWLTGVFAQGAIGDFALKIVVFLLLALGVTAIRSIRGDARI